MHNYTEVGFKVTRTPPLLIDALQRYFQTQRRNYSREVRLWGQGVCLRGGGGRGATRVYDGGLQRYFQTQRRNHSRDVRL